MKIEFERKEIIDLFVSIFILTFIFSLTNSTIKLNSIPLIFLIVCFSYIPRIVIQKYFAKKIGYGAKFKIYPVSSILAILFSPIGIKLASPGYNEVRPYKFSEWKYKRLKGSVEEMARIYLSGVIWNLFLCIISVVFNLNVVKEVNVWISFFNLLPILPFDGAKILKWDFSIWAFFFIFTLILLIL